jgi:hypothetical protein
MDLTSLTLGGAYGQFSNPAGYALETSATGSSIFSTADFATQSPSFANQTISLTGAAFQGVSSISFDVFGYVNNGGLMQFDNFTVDGTLASVPEPNCVALVGMGMLSMSGLKVWRRRA